MKKSFYRFALITFAVLIVLGQLIYLLSSGYFTRDRYEGRIYATIGVEHDGESDLHTLNEGAHYFGQTMIGWTKFPHFEGRLHEQIGYGGYIDFNAYMQERQNIIFTLFTLEPIEMEQLTRAKDFLQAEIDEYNQSSRTKFVLTNVDYELDEITRGYGIGALFAFLTSGVVALAVLFVRREFFEKE